MSKTRQWQIWMGIKARCENKNEAAYKNYGGRGITMCKEWRKFVGFWEDMKDGYSDFLTIDRIDNDKGYFKENCRWATRTQQARNNRANNMIEFNGKTLSIMEWSEEIGIKYGTLYNRICVYGMDIDKAMSKGKLKHNWTGKSHTQETKNKMSKSHKGKVFSDDHKRKMSISAKNRKRK